MKEIGAFIPVSGMRIFIQAIHSMFNLGSLEFYEQSRMAEDGVRRPEGTIQSYKESVVINLSTLWSILKLYQIQKQCTRFFGMDENTIFRMVVGNQTFVILPSKNAGRINTLAEKLLAQDIELYKNDKPLKAEDVLNQSAISLKIILFQLAVSLSQIASLKHL